MRQGELKMTQIVHLEIKVTQMARARKFYGKLFGWKFTPMTKGYLLFSMGKSHGGALDLVKSVAKKNATCPYFDIKDIDATLQLAKKLGGKTVTPKTEIGGGHGFMALFKDSEGNLMGIWSGK